LRCLSPVFSSQTYLGRISARFIEAELSLGQFRPSYEFLLFMRGIANVAQAGAELTAVFFLDFFL
jgi:hypothetical protein